MSSQINNNIAEAIDVLITKRLGDLKLDTTIVGEISSIVDAKEGKYKITYQSAIFEAYVEEKGKTFRVGQSVYVRIPQSDFSQKKIITGRADDNTNEIVKQSLLNYRFILEPTFYFLGAEQVLTASKKNSTEVLITPSVYNEASFLKFANEYSYIQIEASFKANFINSIDKGNYGIRVYFNAFNNEEEEYCLTLDTHSFSGRFYNFASGTKQSKIFQVQRSFLQGVKRIEFFTENFEEDVYNTELKVRDVKINFVDILNISEEEHYVKIQGLDGFLFGDKNLNNPPLNFFATLLKEGKNVTNNEEYLYRWYYYGLDDKNKLDWHEFNLNQETNEPLSTSTIQIYNFKENSRIYNLEVYLKSDLENVLASSTFKIENARIPEIAFEILPIGINVFFKDTKYKGIWYKNNVRINNVAQSSYLISNSEFTTDILDIDCDIYTNEDIKNQKGEIIFSAGEYLGSWNKNFYYKDTYDNFQVDFIGNKLIQYPRNGKFEYSEPNRTFSIEFKYKQEKDNNINAISYFLNDQAILPSDIKKEESKYNSLLKNIYFQEIEKNKKIKFYYNLEKEYDYNKKDSIFKIIIDFTSGAKFEYTYKLECIKKGSEGISSNGYSCRLVPSHDFFCDQKNYSLNLEIYKNGELLSLTENEIKFESVKINEVEVTNPGLVLTLKDMPLNPKEQGNLVMAAISYKNFKLIAYYPIPIATNRSASFEVDPITSVQYNAAGINPRTNVIDSERDYTPSTIFNFTKSGNNSYYIDKILKYNNSNNQEVIYQPVICYLKPEDLTENTPTNWDGQVILNTASNVISALKVSGGRGTEANFTGVTIGTMADGESLQTGIFGHSNGQGTFKITDKGVAYFGKEGGEQIKIDGARQEIAGHSTTISPYYLTLNFAANQPTDNLIVAKYKNNETPTFCANSQGKITSKELEVKGDVKIGQDLSLDKREIQINKTRTIWMGKECPPDIEPDRWMRPYIQANKSKIREENQSTEGIFPAINIHTLAVQSTKDLIIDGKSFQTYLDEIYEAIRDAQKE